jgi:hypothetical protein
MVPTEQCYTLPLLWIEWKETVITEVPFAPPLIFSGAQHYPKELWSIGKNTHIYYGEWFLLLRCVCVSVVILQV